MSDQASLIALLRELESMHVSDKALHARICKHMAWARLQLRRAVLRKQAFTMKRDEMMEQLR